MNDPREMAIRPESGVTLEQDNRIETMYQWGAMVTDLCDLPVSEYMKPMTVIVYGSNYEEPDIPGLLKTENVKIWFTVLKNGNEVSSEPEKILSAGEETDIVWTARWEWTGTFSNQIQVAAVVQTEKDTYNVSAILSDNEEKKYEEEIVEAKGSEAIESYKSYGVASVDTPVEEVTETTYVETVKDENVKYKFEISSAETIVYLNLKLLGVNTYMSMEMRYGDEIPFDKVNIEKEGYNFLYWADSKGNEFTDTTMPYYDLTLTAKYEVKKCNVDFVYVINGLENTVSSITVNYGSKVTKFPPTTMAGYEFKGWTPSTSTVIKEDTIFKGVFESKKMVVTWSGYTSGPIVQEYNYGDEIIVPESPEKEGYTFNKWDKTIPQVVTSNLKFTAQFTINKYTISYFENYDNVLTLLSAVSKNYNTTIVLPRVPSQKGYTYASWESDYEGTVVPSHDIEYITVKTANSYVLAYYDNGIFLKEETYKYLQEITPYKYEKEGWEISEWTGLPTNMPYNNVSAHCTSQIMRFTVTFIDQNGELIERVEGVPYGTSVEEILPVATEGYTYVFDDSVNTEVKNDMEITVEKTIKKYSVTFVFEGNKEVRKLPYGTNIIQYVESHFIPEEGYYLVYTSTHTTVPADNTAIVEYSYEPNVWTLYYATSGCDEININESQEVEYGTNIMSILPNVQVTGYIFNGWFNGESKIEENTTMPNNDLHLIGMCEKELFELRILDDETVIYTALCPYKMTIGEVLNNDFCKNYVSTQSANGYTVLFTLNGEGVNYDMEITESLDIHTLKTPNEYILTFKNSGVVISEGHKKFGEVINYPTMESKTEDGIEYIFVWEDESYNGATMPAKDLIINGQYKEKTLAPIYYGSFVIPVSAYSDDNISQYVSENDVTTNYYKSIAFKECVDVEKLLEIIYPAYPPFEGLSARDYGKQRANYYEPLTILMPINVVNEYSISFKEAITGMECWGDLKTDNITKNINGNDYKVFAMASDGTRPSNTDMLYEYKLKLTKK